MLVGVHALVGETQRLGRLRRFARDRYGAPGRADMKARAMLAQGVAAERDQVEARTGRPLCKQTELVAAHAVSVEELPRARHEPAAQEGQQRVAGGMAERVVVRLEAVEIEQRQRRGSSGA